MFIFILKISPGLVPRTFAQEQAPPPAVEGEILL